MAVYLFLCFPFSVSGERFPSQVKSSHESPEGGRQRERDGLYVYMYICISLEQEQI